MKVLQADIALDEYDLKSVVRVLKDKLKSRGTQFLLSSVNTLVPEKIIELIIKNSMIRNKVVKWLNGKLKGKDNEIIANVVDLSVSKNEDNLNVSLNCVFYDYAGIVKIVKSKIDSKLGDERLKNIVRSAIDVIASEIPDKTKDTIILSIIKNNENDLCEFLSDLLLKKGMEVHINKMTVYIGD